MNITLIVLFIIGISYKNASPNLEKLCRFVMTGASTLSVAKVVDARAVCRDAIV